MLSRTLGVILVLALLTGIASSAQCVVRCIRPVAPARCHHHPPAKQTQTQCADSMAVSDTHVQIAPLAIVQAPSPLIFNAVVIPTAQSPEPGVPTPHPDPPSILRI